MSKNNDTNLVVDNTKAKGILPQAGDSKLVIVFSLLMLAFIMIVIANRYEQNDI